MSRLNDKFQLNSNQHIEVR